MTRNQFEAKVREFQARPGHVKNRGKPGGLPAFHPKGTGPRCGRWHSDRKQTYRLLINFDWGVTRVWFTTPWEAELYWLKHYEHWDVTAFVQRFAGYADLCDQYQL